MGEPGYERSLSCLGLPKYPWFLGERCRVRPAPESGGIYLSPPTGACGEARRLTSVSGF